LAVHQGTNSVCFHVEAARAEPLAFALGEADIDAYARSHGVDRQTAIRIFERQRQNGRNPSRCMNAIIG
jgi:hypothetical protein